MLTSRRALLACFVGMISVSAVLACSEAARRPAPYQAAVDPVEAGPEAGPEAVKCEPDPGKWDVPGNGCDEDGDGTIDNPPTCDQALATGSAAEDFAKALGICATITDPAGYGLVTAKVTRGYGVEDPPAPGSWAVLPKFGNTLRPREGARFGVLSTGYANEYDEPIGGADAGADGGSGLQTPFNGGVSRQITGTAPPGFPSATPGCGSGGGSVNDLVNVRLVLKAPKNALGFKFDFNFHSGEWPEYVCSSFNDAFIAFYRSPSANGGVGRNVSFDKNGRAVSVNNGFFDRCTPGILTGCKTSSMQKVATCPGGQGELQGTGFGLIDDWCPTTMGGAAAPSSSGGATGWLTSQAIAKAGETFTLEFMIWDATDHALDSLVLIDNFQWIGEPILTEETIRPDSGIN